jgi:GAF domain-containing protein
MFITRMAALAWPHMKYPPLPEQENERLKCLRSLDVLDTSADRRLDAITQAVAAHYDVPIVLVSLVDRRRQWFKSRLGLEATETARAYSFCGHAIYSPAPVFVVGDALANRDFADNPLVVGPPHVRFYAGTRISSPEGLAIGTLCMIDTKPCEFADNQFDELIKSAKRCEDILFEGRTGDKPE